MPSTAKAKLLKAVQNKLQGARARAPSCARSLVVMTDEPGWHGKVLRAAFARHGFRTSFISLSRCGFDLESRFGIRIPGFEDTLPDAVFVRGIASGSFEQVTLRLDALHALQHLGVPVYNEARAIERSVDKAMTSFLLKHAGIATLATWVTEAQELARRRLMHEAARGNEVVIKPLFGSQGVGLRRLTKGSALPSGAAYAGVYYLQRFVDTGEGRWHDFRVLVVGGRAVAAMRRRGTSWISNVARGASCESVPLDADLTYLAEACAHVLGLDYAGVDILRGADGSAWVIEVNSMPAWSGLQTVVSVDLAGLLAEDLVVRRLPQHSLTGTRP
ncbi:MAG: RimK family alpha-L-glutamate ligase [Burkholderiaceae bacterium]